MYSMEDVTKPFDPVSECLTCPPCAKSTQARIAGCTGTAINDPPQCVDCQTCPRGQFVLGQCSAVGSVGAEEPSPITCEPCPDCLPGKYLARRCTGQSINTPDYSCEPCATCARDHYIGMCTSSLQGAVPAWDRNSSVELPVPVDAGVCIPCRKCAKGYYLSKRCDGKKTYDDSECLPCNSKCPDGMYMHAQCNGSTFEPDSNDCRSALFYQCFV